MLSKGIKANRTKKSSITLRSYYDTILDNAAENDFASDSDIFRFKFHGLISKGSGADNISNISNISATPTTGFDKDELIEDLIAVQSRAYSTAATSASPETKPARFRSPQRSICLNL